ncbi:hypothetical protein T439DRAFT_73686 [Meredithblackwellia eburnea MCA 4105]
MSTSSSPSNGGGAGSSPTTTSSLDLAGLILPTQTITTTIAATTQYATVTPKPPSSTAMIPQMTATIVGSVLAGVIVILAAACVALFVELRRVRRKRGIETGRIMQLQDSREGNYDKDGGMGMGMSEMGLRSMASEDGRRGLLAGSPTLQPATSSERGGSSVSASMDEPSRSVHYVDTLPFKRKPFSTPLATEIGPRSESPPPLGPTQLGSPASERDSFISTHSSAHQMQTTSEKITEARPTSSVYSTDSEADQHVHFAAAIPGLTSPSRSEGLTTPTNTSFTKGSSKKGSGGSVFIEDFSD